MPRDKDNLKAWRKKNRAKLSAAHKAYIDRRKVADPAWYRRKNRASALRKYGITQVDFEQKWSQQDGRCAICKKPFKAQFNACIDHDHVSGTLRDLLCRPCNIDMAIVDDDVRLADLLAYRNAHREKQP